MSLLRVLFLFSFGVCILSCGKNLNVGKNKLKDGAGNEISDNILIPKGDGSTTFKEPPATAKEAFEYFVGALQDPYKQGCIFSPDQSTVKGGTQTEVDSKKVITVNGESGLFTIEFTVEGSGNDAYKYTTYKYENYKSRGLILNNITTVGPLTISDDSSDTNKFGISGGMGISGFFTATLQATNLKKINNDDASNAEGSLTFTYKLDGKEEVLTLSKDENLDLLNLLLKKA